LSNNTEIISPANLQTVVVVCFILALLSLAFNFYNFSRVNAAIMNTHTAHFLGNKTDLALVDRINRLSSLEGRLKEIEREMAESNQNPAPAPLPTPLADPAAPAQEPAAPPQ
jgi:hypothetical protein